MPSGRGMGRSKLFSAQRGGGFLTSAQWSGHRGPAAGGRESRAEKVESRHRGPPPRHPVSGPRWTVCSVGCPADGGWADPSRSLPSGTGVFGWIPIGADTEVRPPATLFLAPGERSSRMDAQRTGAGAVRGLFSAQRGGGFRMDGQRADTDVRAPGTLILAALSGMWRGGRALSSRRCAPYPRAIANASISINRSSNAKPATRNEVETGPGVG